ncbi:phospholipase [Thermostilla marina]
MNPLEPHRKFSLDSFVESCLEDSDSAPSRRSLSDTEKTLFAPLHYEPKYPYPLLVWLHGGETSDNRELLQIMPKVSLSNYVSVAPRGLSIENGSKPTFGWPQTLEGIIEAEQRTFECIAAAHKRFHIDRRRIFIGGFGEGGTMAVRIAWRNPQVFCGAVSLCGPLPEKYQPFAGFVQARQIPMFLAVGRDSDYYSPCKAGENLKLLHTAGVNVTLRQYPCGQELSPYMLADLNEWIMAAITEEDASCDPLDAPGSCRGD